VNGVEGWSGVEAVGLGAVVVNVVCMYVAFVKY
jgi:hypothetical protein